MTRCKTIWYAVCLLAGLSTLAIAQQDSLPNQPFRTVHLMELTPAQETQHLTAVKDFNTALTKQGCPSCAYHVFKVSGTANSKYNYLMISDWPGAQAYAKIHASEDFTSAGKRNPIMSEIRQTELYNRYVEIK